MTNVTRLESSFSFRTKDGYKRPTVAVEYDVPNAAGVIELLQGEDQKVVNLITDTVQSVITSYIRGFVDQDQDFSQETLDALVAEGKINLAAIANLPKTERNVLSKDDLEAFAKDYIAIMPEATGKEKAKVELAAGLFIQRYKPVAGKKEVLNVLVEQLGVFMEAAGDELVTKHSKALDYLVDKAQELLSIEVTADAL